MNQAVAQPLMSLHPAFELMHYQTIDNLAIDVYVCEHKQTKAIHYHLAHASDENAFMVGFRTQPMDSRGTAHILEHTALCGSKRYPVRDPFFSMLKRSLQTFMNAMTASDWTAYPFATQNKKDFFNLLSVYLDAAFFPLLEPLDFAQEGIRVELNDNNQPEFKGIVFNEMKGAMSGEIDQLYHALTKHLYPTTTYHYNSGGDPADIPDLTHADLVDFHRNHYHPSNSVLMTFGNLDIAEIQTELHESALVHFSVGKKHISFAEQRYSQPQQVVETYATDDAGKQQTHHVVAWLLPSMTDPKMRLAMRLVDGLLTEHSGSPLQAYLESTPLGTAASPLVGLHDSNFEMAYYAGVRGSEPEHAEQLEQEILQVLHKVVSNPITEQEIATVLHQIELDQRHIGGDSMPYGLNLILEGFSNAVHDGNPLDAWELDEHLQWLKNQLTDPNWLPELIQHHLIDNTHRVRLTLVPDSNKTKAMQAAEQQRLDALAATLTAKQQATLQQQAVALQQRQQQPDDLSLLPKVGLKDIPASISFAQGETRQVTINNQPVSVYCYPTGTNGLYYHQLLLPLSDDLMSHPLLSTYTTLLGELGTSQYTAREFQAVQVANSSGIAVRTSVRTDIKDADTMQGYFVISIRALADRPYAMNLIQQVLMETVFTETDRILELLRQKQSGWQSRLSGNGHAYALQTATRQTSAYAQRLYALSGLPALVALKHSNQTIAADTQAMQDLCAALAALHRQIQSLPKHALIIAEEDTIDSLVAEYQQQWQSQSLKENSVDLEASDTAKGDRSSYASNVEDSVTDGSRIAEDLAWCIQTNVYHNATAYPAVPADHIDAPVMMVLAPYLRNGYLHTHIREQGGAYGGGAGYDGNAASFKFYSYRDPNCQKTFAHFTQSIDWLLTHEQSDEQLEEAIMNVIANIDKPGSPAGEAVSTCFAHLHGRPPEWQEKTRQQILAVTLADLKRVAQTYLKDKPYTRACLAPYSASDNLTALGFVVKKMPV